MPWVLGLDGGGSKTTALIADETGRIRGRGESGPSNYHTAGLAEASHSIRVATRTALAAAGLDAPSISAAFFGLAGCDRLLDRQVMSGLLAGLGLGCPISLENDAVSALAGATGGRPGVIIVASTGSIAFGEDPHGLRARAGGYGPLLGDEGSGYEIGRKGLVAALRAEDGRSPATTLTDRIKQRFLLERASDLINLVYGNPAPLQRPDIAALSTLVVEEANAGDGICREILRVAGRELGLLAAAVLQRLDWRGWNNIPVAGSGGIFSAGHLLMLPLQQVVTSACPQAVMIQPKHSPAYGSVLLALRTLGIRLENPPGEQRT